MQKSIGLSQSVQRAATSVLFLLLDLLDNTVSMHDAGLIDPLLTEHKRRMEALRNTVLAGTPGYLCALFDRFLTNEFAPIGQVPELSMANVGRVNGSPVAQRVYESIDALLEWKRRMHEEGVKVKMIFTLMTDGWDAKFSGGKIVRASEVSDEETARQVGEYLKLGGYLEAIRIAEPGSPQDEAIKANLLRIGIPEKYQIPSGRDAASIRRAYELSTRRSQNKMAAG